MTVTTVPVTVRLADFDGDSVAGIEVTARMSDVDFTAEGTFVANDTVTAFTDASGIAVLNLFPNATIPTGLGTRGTTVRVRASMPGSRRLSVLAVIPNQACSLASCIVSQEPTGLDASQLAAADAQAARDLAKKWAIQTASEVEAGQGFGAKKYAIDAAASAAQAAADRSVIAGAIGVTERVQEFTGLGPWLVTNTPFVGVTKVAIDGRLYRLNNFNIVFNSVSVAAEIPGLSADSLVDIYHV